MTNQASRCPRIGTSISIALIALVCFPQSATAQQLGDAKRGLAYAERSCADCHAVRATAAASPDPRATPFRVLAQHPGMNERALSVFLSTPHKEMPNLIVPPGDRDDLIAHILSLRPTPQR